MSVLSFMTQLAGSVAACVLVDIVLFVIVIRLWVFTIETRRNLNAYTRAQMYKDVFACREGGC